MTINQNNYFDLYNIFANELIGNVWLTIIIGILIIFLISIKTRVPYPVTILFTIVWLGVVYAATFIQLIWVLLIIFVGVVFYYKLSQLFR